MKLHELLERRAAVVAEMRALDDKASTEKRDLTADEDKRFGELKTDLADLDKKIARAQMLAEAERSAPAVVRSGRIGDGDYEVRARDFSLVKAINAQLGDPVDAGFEREVSGEVRRRSGRTFQGIAVPDEYFHVERRAFGDNVLTIGGNAADLYPTMHRPDLFIDRLRSALVVGRLGATVLDGLVGTNDIPRQTASASAAWVDEDGSLSDTAQDFDDVTLAPKTIGAISSYSRRTLINAQPSIESIVRNDLASVIANAIDAAALLGTGMSNQPTGVVNQSNVFEITLAGGVTWAAVLEFIASIQHADADIGGLGWAMNAHVAKTLRSTLKVAEDAAAGFIMMTPGDLAGYAAAVTSALPGYTPPGEPTSAVAATLIFGAWSQLLVGYWSGLDVLVNPYETTAYQKGRVLIRAMRDCDVQVRHPEAFAFADDLTLPDLAA